MRYETKVWHYIRFELDGWCLTEIECEAVVAHDGSPEDWKVTGFIFSAHQLDRGLAASLREKKILLPHDSAHPLVVQALAETQTTRFEEDVQEALSRETGVYFRRPTTIEQAVSIGAGEWR